TDCFDYFVWSCIVASVILIGVALQSFKLAFDFLFLFVNQTVRGKWSKLSPWLAISLIAPVILSIYYQSYVTSDVISPARTTQIENAQELFLKRNFKLMVAVFPKETAMDFKIAFGQRGLEFSHKYFEIEEILQNMSPSSAEERARLAAKHESKGAILVDKSKADYALAMTRYLYPHLKCNVVKEDWVEYWDTWMIKSLLADRMYVTKFRLMQAGFYPFWDSLTRYQRLYFSKAKAHGILDMGFKPLNLFSTIWVVFKLYLIMITISVLSFTVEMFLRLVTTQMIRVLIDVSHPDLV
ncbi:unnamed protein product, partial [Allacma fusca]